MEGIFAVYKDEGMTSHDVVDVVRRCSGQKRVGHAGTLDPCAKGILIIGVGRPATRQLGQITDKEKEYLALIKLGWRSTTDDREGQKEAVACTVVPSEQDVSKALAKFEGIIQQKPCAFSAVKIAGKPAYKLARARKQLDLKTRDVLIKEIELLRYDWPMVEIRMVTGPGVYVRAVARDLGELLGTGGFVEQLERTRVGPYTKDLAISVSDLKQGKRPHLSLF